MNVDLKKYLTQRLYSDVETKGFDPDVNMAEDVHCLCSITEDDQVLLFHDHPEYDNEEVYDPDDKKTFIIPPRAGTLIEGVRYWYLVGKNGGKLSVHNCMTFDKPVIEKIWEKCEIPLSTWEDTYIQSKVQWFDRPCPKGAKSAHGLKAYGIKFGNKKPEVTDWKTMDAYKLHRVVEDCKIQKMTALFLDREAETLKLKYGMDFTQAIRDIEMPYAIECHKQERSGALVDKPHIEKCIIELDETTDALAAYIEPLLPKSLKNKTGRIGRKELVALLYNNKEVEDEYDAQGEVVKRYYKPHTNFYNKADTTYYEGFHLSYGESPKFEKLAELREWVKVSHSDTKFKEWEYQKIVVEGKKLDNGTCSHFEVEDDALNLIAGPHTRFTFHDSKLTQHEIVKGYLITQGIKWAEVWNVKKDSEGNFVRAEENTEIRYPLKAPPHQQMVYEVRKGEPLVTSPKFGEKEYEQLGDDSAMGKDIAKYNTYMHRRRFFSNVKDPENKGLLSYIREDGRVPCGLGNFMTSSGRSNQRVIVNLPSEKALYGAEMRKTIIAPRGRSLVGVDQKSSQLSIAAFIANNEDYYNAVAAGKKDYKDESGKDIYLGESAHCVNARNFGLVSESDWREAVLTQNPKLIATLNMQRDKYAKGASFGVIFGCSGKKLGLMLDVSAQEGNEKKNMFLRQMGLDSVIEYVNRCAEQFKYGGGFYIPVFGYWLWCRSPHVGVNYFCQGLEAIVQKIAVLKFTKALKDRGDTSTMVVLQVHDEVLIECDEDLADGVGKLMCECYTQTGVDMLNWYKENEWAFPAGGSPKICVDFAGGYSIGKNYYEVH